MPRPCTCDRVHPDPTAPYTPAQCRLCWLYHYRPDYQALWDGTSLCRHLGGATGARVRCPGCRGTVALKLYACAVHGSCTPATAVPGIACCPTCADREPRG